MTPEVAPLALHIDRLYRYPVKSMLGEQLTSVAVDSSGLAGDRGYAIRDRRDGAIASAKNPKKWGRLFEFRAAYLAEPQAGEPLPPVAITFPDGSVHRSDEPGIDRLLSETVGREVTLVEGAIGGRKEHEVVWLPEGRTPQQVIDQKGIGVQDGLALGRTAFGRMSPDDRYFDYSPVHVITNTTLQHLEALEPDASFDARRFRPNLVLDTDGAGFVENHWRGLSLVGSPSGAASDTGTSAPVIRILSEAVRCVMVTLPREGLARDHKTLRALATHNRIELEGRGGRWACAGVFADVYRAGALAVGDRLALCATPADAAPIRR